MTAKTRHLGRSGTKIERYKCLAQRCKLNRLATTTARPCQLFLSPAYKSVLCELVPSVQVICFTTFVTAFFYVKNSTVSLWRVDTHFTTFSPAGNGHLTTFTLDDGDGRFSPTKTRAESFFGSLVILHDLFLRQKPV